MIKKCQVFTPPEIASDMLDMAGYKDDLFEKRFLENASGDGVIFLAAIERYIKDAIEKRYSLKEIQIGIEKNLFAYEIDIKHIKTCIQKADRIAQSYGLIGIKWNIKTEDFLKSDINQKFEYIVGNPPYIKYNEIPNVDREFIVKAFDTCREGKPDYCYPFIEKSINILSIDGILVYLIPNSIFKNEFAHKLRLKILPGLNYIKDFTSMKLFPALTQSAIIKFSNNDFTDYFKYEDVVDNNIIEINKSTLKKKWIFDSKYINYGSDIFSDYFITSSSIATLYNKAFIVNGGDLSNQYVEINGVKIETEVLREAVSIKSLRNNVKQLIIFPYKFDENGELERYSETDFKKLFPGCISHLRQYDRGLKRRKSDINAQWFEYGRSQAISKMQCNKLLVSKIFTNSIKVYFLGENTIPYSGNIIVKKTDISLNVAKKILESHSFIKYAKKIGNHASGGSYQISAKDINNFKFDINHFL